MLKISPLFSGSKGNCTLIQSPNAAILLDVGFTYRATVAALAQKGVSPQDISAIVVTHEHSDHIGALPIWTRHTPAHVFAPHRIADLVRQRVCLGEVTDIDGEFDVEDVHICHYECDHDAVCCFGYKFTCGSSRFACVTDTGHSTEELVDFLRECSAIMLESNHDVDMLIKGEYSPSLKQRILSPYGHLSNSQAAEVLASLANSEVRTVVLAHLSEKNNNKELAFRSAVQALASCGVVEGRDVCVYVADQYKNEVTVCLD